MSWTDDRTEQLKALWPEGHSASQIASILGGGITRNSVIGKVHRLGLTGRATSPRHTRSRVGGGMPKSPALPKIKPAELIHSDVLRIEGDLPATDDPQSATGCRWPIGEVGDPSFRYCQRTRGKRLTGAPSMWCPEHHALGHQKGVVTEKKRWNGW